MFGEESGSACGRGAAWGVRPSEPAERGVLPTGPGGRAAGPAPAHPHLCPKRRISGGRGCAVRGQRVALQASPWNLEAGSRGAARGGGPGAQDTQRDPPPSATASPSSSRKEGARRMPTGRAALMLARPWAPREHGRAQGWTVPGPYPGHGPASEDPRTQNR